MHTSRFLDDERPTSQGTGLAVSSSPLRDRDREKRFIIQNATTPPTFTQLKAKRRGEKVSLFSLREFLYSPPTQTPCI